MEYNANSAYAYSSRNWPWDDTVNSINGNLQISQLFGKHGYFTYECIYAECSSFSECKYVCKECGSSNEWTNSLGRGNNYSLDFQHMYAGWLFVFEKFGYYKIDYHIAADYELLIRFLYVHRLKSKYLSLDFMKMRTGGASTASIKSNILLNKEIVRACSENGIWTCMPLLFLKYFIKVFELFLTKE